MRKPFAYKLLVDIMVVFLAGSMGMWDAFYPNALAASMATQVYCAPPKTGQTTSYQAADDGDYQKGWSGTRFTNNGDGTITDNATSLMWVANPASAGAGGTYTWDKAITACKSLTYAGYNDWRLPNLKELISIVDYGVFNPAVNPYFASQSLLCWSSTTSASYKSGAWLVDFNYGLVVNIDKSDSFYIRPVRGGQ